MAGTVFFYPVHSEDAETSKEKMRALLERLELSARFKRGDLIGIKVHVGEGKKRTFLGAELAAVTAKEITRLGGKPFFTDSCVLYRSSRADAVSHTLHAWRHGYSMGKAGAPFIAADGLTGTDEETVLVMGGKRISVAGVARRAGGFVTLSHPTGHVATGFGGVLKTLGMGLASRKGKLSMHSVSKPFIKKKSCTGCGECVLWCPQDAIRMDAGKADIDQDSCIGCGECLAMCRVGAVGFDWKTSSKYLQERIAENALAVVTAREERFIHVAIALRITKDCDCVQDPGPQLFPDIGLLGSSDPVALDQATLDLIQEKTGKSIRQWGYQKIDPTFQLIHGETIGLGSRDYKLIELE